MIKYILITGVLAAIVLFALSQWESKQSSNATYLLKDRAIVYRSAEDYRQFREGLAKYEEPKKRGFAASWFTQEKVMLLPKQRVEILAQDPPLLQIRIESGGVFYTTISQIHDDSDETTLDLVEQMIKGD